MFMFLNLYQVGRNAGKILKSYDGKKKKSVTTIQLTKNYKIGRMYALKIKYSFARCLQYIFVNHISREAKVTTDKWRGCRPIAKAFDKTQIESNMELYFKATHTIIHQVKCWIRTPYYCVNNSSLNKCSNEFYFRVNGSQNKTAIFNNLIMKMV